MATVVANDMSVPSGSVDLEIVVPNVDEAVTLFRQVLDAVELWRECLLDGSTLAAGIVLGAYHLVLTQDLGRLAAASEMEPR
jgi:hypothetical protein